MFGPVSPPSFLQLEAGVAMGFQPRDVLFQFVAEFCAGSRSLL